MQKDKKVVPWIWHNVGERTATDDKGNTYPCRCEYTERDHLGDIKVLRRLYP